MADGETPVADNTPDTPPVTPAPADPPAPVQHSDDLRTLVTHLEQTVNGLVERIELLTPDPRDTTPTKKPWTHRFGSGH